MNKTAILLLTATLVIFSNGNLNGNQYDVPQKIIVSGKVDNYDPSREVILAVNRIGSPQERIPVKTDSVGNFTAAFESYTPVDAWLFYRINFLVLFHPGDSLFVRFDGQSGSRPAIMNSIEFGGDAAQVNKYAAKFQHLYYSSELFNNRDRQERAVKEYGAEQYLQYLDTIQQKCRELYDQFVSDNNPDNESKKWALLLIENEYYSKLGWYAMEHRQVNNMAWDWDVPSGFYDKFLNGLPIAPSMFISAFALSSFADNFSSYVHAKSKDKGSIVKTKADSDSINIYSIIEFVPDPLLRQIMLTNSFNRDFHSEQNITNYERFRNVAETYITEPFLKESLQNKYHQTKFTLESPEIYTKTILKEATNLSISQLIDEIFQNNKGKVIYVDFWATWCGPCLAEFPSSKKVEHEFDDKNVAFVYLCLDSEEIQWKATIDRFQLGGQHYHLSTRQSTEIRNLFGISGIPDYLLIDKNGVIKEKGSHLRPLFVRGKITEMLK